MTQNCLNISNSRLEVEILITLNLMSEFLTSTGTYNCSVKGLRQYLVLRPDTRHLFVDLLTVVPVQVLGMCQ